MHDPLTQAHQIKIPLFFKRENSWLKSHPMEWQFYTLITIWHKDPERGGSDDSCGWSWPRCTKKQKERIHNLAWGEGRNPYFLRQSGREWTGTMAEAEAMERGLLLLVADVIGVKLSFEEASRMAARHIHQADCCHPANKFCFEAGYHSNSKIDRASDREDQFEGLCFGAARRILDLRRPRWKHPKWHVHHWRIQFHFWQLLRRWVFSRCWKCGGGFKWNESVISDGHGKRIWHNKCDAEHPLSTGQEQQVA